MALFLRLGDQNDDPGRVGLLKESRRSARPRLRPCTIASPHMRVLHRRAQVIEPNSGAENFALAPPSMALQAALNTTLRPSRLEGTLDRDRFSARGWSTPERGRATAAVLGVAIAILVKPSLRQTLCSHACDETHATVPIASLGEVVAPG